MSAGEGGASPGRGRRRAADGLAAVALLLLPWLLYGRARELWWTQDDFFQLRFASRFGFGEYLLDPEVWRQLPNRVLSPLLFASYDLDLALAGLDPAFFYGHQLVSLGLAAAALYGLLRFWLAPPWALLGGIVFLLGPPVASLAPLLMVRHYPEALALALASAAAFVAGVRRQEGGGRALSGLSAALYLAAALAKEIAVPLPLLLALLPEGRLRERISRLLPHAVALAAYGLYRAWMLGAPLGGYGWAVAPGEWPWLALRLPLGIARELAGPSPAGWAALALLASGLVLWVARARGGGWLVGAGGAAALLPILPVATEVAPRFATATWLLLAAGVAPVARRFASGERGPGAAGRALRPWVAAVLAVFLAAAFVANRAAWREHFGRAARMSAENLTVLQLEPGELLRQPLGSPAAMAELQRFAREHLGARPRGGWFYDDLFLCETPLPVRRLWSFDPATGRARDVTAELAEIRQRRCAAIRWEAPLEAVFAWRRGALFWALGPHPEEPGSGYGLLLEDGRFAYDVPRRGGFHYGGALAGLRVRYRSKEGWVTYSPPFDLDPERAARFAWNRP